MIVVLDGRFGAFCMTKTAFLTPELHGGRFEKHIVPLEFLKDLTALQSMVFEVAKQKFREANPDRQRLTKGFTDGIELGLSGIEEGSTKLVIEILVAGTTLQPAHPSAAYFDQAKEAIIDVIQASESKGAIASHLSPEAIRLFDRLGKGLRDGESFQLSSPSSSKKATLTREARRNILLSIPDLREYEEDTVFCGVVTGINWDKCTIDLISPDGQPLSYHYTGAEQGEIAKEILREKSNLQYGQTIKLSLSGTGKFSRQRKLLEFVSVEEITLLDPLDVNFRLDELRHLSDGWMDGEGKAPSASGLDWFAGSFELWKHECPLPYIYPTVAGGLSVEWTIERRSMSLEVDLTGHSAYWHCTDLEAKTARDRDLNLDEPSAWEWVVKQLKEEDK